MKLTNRLLRSFGIAALLCIAPIVLHAQVAPGIVLSLNAYSQNVQQAGGDLKKLLDSGNVSATEFLNNIGFGIAGRLKVGLGSIRVVGDVGYVFFAKTDVALVQAGVSGDTANGTFEVGTTMIPICAGLELVPFNQDGALKPYLGAQLSYTFIKRTYTNVSGTTGGISGASVSTTPAGEDEIGLNLMGGLEFSLLGSNWIFGGRYSMTNMFSQASGEKPMSYLQIEIGLLFGSLN